MKKFFNLTFFPVVLMLIVSLTSCSKDDDNGPLDDFDYPAETIYGTWKVTRVATIIWPYETTTATFNSDGTYRGRGYFGTGSGTYSGKGKTLSCYIDGELYCRYEVESLSGTTAVLKMYAADSSTSLTLTCEKQ